jgi:glucose-1-phosphate thymidylyltransferase
VIGIILAGGVGTRLWPLTKGISKQLLPIYDKPMIYYPLSTLMLAGIKEVCIITTPRDLPLFKNLLGTGEQLGMILHYFVQDNPNGIAEAFLITRKVIEGRNCVLILGDNIFHGPGVGRNLEKFKDISGAQIFAYSVADPSEFGVVVVDEHGKAKEIVEKPDRYISNLAVTGLYFYDKTVSEKAQKLEKSNRGELEITAINELYLKEEKLFVEILNRGTVWLDGGTIESLNSASEYVRIIEERQGYKVGCIEEIAWRNGWINDEKLQVIANSMKHSPYSDYLIRLRSN